MRKRPTAYSTSTLIPPNKVMNTRKLRLSLQLSRKHVASILIFFHPSHHPHRPSWLIYRIGTASRFLRYTHCISSSIPRATPHTCRAKRRTRVRKEASSYVFALFPLVRCHSLTRIGSDAPAAEPWTQRSDVPTHRSAESSARTTTTTRRPIQS